MAANKNGDIFESSVRREKSKQVVDVVERLNKNRKFADRAMFSTIKDVMTFAAYVGKLTGRKKALSGETEIINRKEIYDDTKNLGFMYLLAINELDTLDVIKSEKNREQEAQVVRIFEEYANAGFYEIYRWLEDKQHDEVGSIAVTEGIIRLLSQNDGPLPKPKIS
jgi:dnd system-associated protein 4